MEWRKVDAGSGRGDRGVQTHSRKRENYSHRRGHLNDLRLRVMGCCSVALFDNAALPCERLQSGSQGRFNKSTQKRTNVTDTAGFQKALSS